MSHRIARVAVCLPQVPFIRGGAEILADALTEQLRERGLEADLVTVPFVWQPNDDLLANALTWRMLDLTHADGQPIDAVIGTKFPSYLVRHPRKVIWLFHQFRQAYDMHGTPFAQFGDDAAGDAMRRTIAEMDERAFAESRGVFTISANVSARLEHHNGVASTTLPPPPQNLDLEWRADDGYVLSVGRLNRSKRLDLLIEALALAPGATAVIVGDGPDRERLKKLARTSGVAERVEFRGRVSEEALADAYGRARCVFYGPFDEDYGFVPLEALRAEKPVLSTTDAGGALEHVVDGRTGIVREPSAEALAQGLQTLNRDPGGARRLGAEGRRHVEGITWDAVIDPLLEAMRN